MSLTSPAPEPAQDGMPTTRGMKRVRAAALGRYLCGGRSFRWGAFWASSRASRSH